MTTSAFLPAVDRAAFVTGFAIQLRRRGLAVAPSAVEDFVRGLAAAWPTTRGQMYWTARICLVRRHEDLAVFDAIFAAVFEDAFLPADPNARRRGPDATVRAAGRSTPAAAKSSADSGAGADLPWITPTPALAVAENSDTSIAVAERLPARLAALADTPFEQLRPADLAQLGDWLARAIRTWPTRRSRRLAEASRGDRVSMRRTIALARRTAWEPVHLGRASPLRKPRRTVMLCDVSQSMQAQAAAYLHVMRALALVADAEVFAFATSLTRLTPALVHRSTDTAVARASALVADRFGGTRIATNIATLLHSRHADSVRGAVVIIGSDGWDSDPAPALATQMARLRRRAYRIVWLNPRAGDPAYEPRVASMAAALPYCDALLPADTFAALARAIRVMALNPTASHGSRAGTARS